MTIKGLLKSAPTIGVPAHRKGITILGINLGVIARGRDNTF
jgi:hypothetical protein